MADVAKKDLGLIVAGTIFGFIALLHLVRVLARLEANLGNLSLPLWLSTAGFVIGGALSLWFFLLAKK